MFIYVNVDPKLWRQYAEMGISDVFLLYPPGKIFFCGNQSVLIELHQSGVIAWQQQQHRRSCGVFKSWISVAHCPFEWKWWVLHIWYIFILEQVGMSFNGISHLMKVKLLFKWEFPRVLHDGVTHCSCANFKCEVADVDNGIPNDFGAIRCVFVESDQPYYDNISWYIQFD